MTCCDPPLVCVICGAKFLIADDHACIDASVARQLGRREGDAICHSCWINRILTRPDGTPFYITGHC
jgi:hypothetical protein